MIGNENRVTNKIFKRSTFSREFHFLSFDLKPIGLIQLNGLLFILLHCNNDMTKRERERENLCVHEFKNAHSKESFVPGESV